MNCMTVQTSLQDLLNSLHGTWTAWQCRQVYRTFTPKNIRHFPYRVQAQPSLLLCNKVGRNSVRTAAVNLSRNPWKLSTQDATFPRLIGRLARSEGWLTNQEHFTNTRVSRVRFFYTSSPLPFRHARTHARSHTHTHTHTHTQTTKNNSPSHSAAISRSSQMD
jgi:hypothetical protein